MVIINISTSGVYRMTTNIDQIRTHTGTIDLKIFANGLYAILNRNLSNVCCYDDIHRLNTLKMNGYSDIRIESNELFTGWEIQTLSDEDINQLLVEFIRDHIEACGLETAQENLDRIRENNLFNTYATLDTEELFFLGVIASGMCIQLDKNEVYEDILPHTDIFIDREELENTSIDQLCKHPFFPTYAIPTQTFRIESNKLSDIECLFFNQYGEYIRSGHLQGQYFNKAIAAEDGILATGFSPSFEHYLEN